jgi:hypothetical protein
MCKVHEFFASKGAQIPRWGTYTVPVYNIHIRFLCLYLFEVVPGTLHFHHSSKIKSHLKSYKTVETKFFFFLFAC